MDFLEIMLVKTLFLLELYLNLTSQLSFLVLQVPSVLTTEFQ